MRCIVGETESVAIREVFFATDAVVVERNASAASPKKIENFVPSDGLVLVDNESNNNHSRFVFYQ